MKREQLEHLIRAAAAITNEYELVVVGSQSILGAYPNAPAELLMSNEADMYPRNRPELADLIEGSIGELSKFDEMYGYYAQGVSPKTAVLPRGWEDRLVRVQTPNTDLKIGLCLEPCDLAASKLAAGRPKDHIFVDALLRHQMVDAQQLLERIATLPVNAETKQRLCAWVYGHTKEMPPRER